MVVVRPLKVVVASDARNVALKLAADLDQCGFAPTFSVARSQQELEQLLPGSDFVVAWRAAETLPPLRVLALCAGRRETAPVVVYGESFSEDEVVGFVRAGARDCVRGGDLVRIRRAFEPDSAPAPGPQARPHDPAESYRELIEEIPALTYVAWADESGSRAYVSPQLESMCGYTPREWTSEPDMWARRLHPEDRERVLRGFQEACLTGECFAAEYRLLDREGRVVWWRDEGRVLPGEDGHARFVRGFVLDITEQKLAEESLRRLRFYDQVTGLPNRVLMQRRLGRALADAAQTARSVALVIVAIDAFRDVTNTLGHENGELIVRELAERLREAVGDGDRVARLRGDEFGLLLPDADATAARELGDGVLRVLERPFTVGGVPIEVSASLGVAVGPDHGRDADALLRRADAAVQTARRIGGGASVVYSQNCEVHDPAHLALLGELRRALEGDELRLCYQPKVDLKTHAVVGAEALLRWPHARRGLVPPAEFVALAERTGLIHLLTRWVLDRAAGEARGWERAGRRLPVAVNVSARSLRDGRLVDEVEEALLTHDLDPHRLEIEVTESAFLTDPGRAAQVLGQLKGRGVAVSIDDFGTGYSSLALLRRLPVSELKIDRSFVMGMAGDGGEDTAIVRSTADLAHNLGLNVVAEGVENQWTLDLLGTFGCDQAQGFHIARPMRSDDLVEWLGTSAWRTVGS